MGGGSNGNKGAGGKGKGQAVKFTDWLCTCGFKNFGSRATCRDCDDAPPPGARRPKGAGKGDRGGAGGGSGGGANAWGIGGIAQRQLRQQAEAELHKKKIEKLRSEHNKQVEKLQRQLEAARRGQPGPVEVDLEDADDDEDEDFDEKERVLVAEQRQVELCLKGLDDGSPFKEAARKRVDEIKGEVADIRERKGGPEAKVLGMAGRHFKELRSARQKLLRKTRAQTRLEEEASDLAKNVEELQDKLKGKRKELDEVKEEVQQAKSELEKLAKATEESQEVGQDEDADDRPKGPRARAQLLAGQLSAHIPPQFKAQLAALVEAAVSAAEDNWGDSPSLRRQQQPQQQQLAAQQQLQASQQPAQQQQAQQAAEQGAAAAAPQQKAMGSTGVAGGGGGEDDDDQMADLAGSTLTLLDTLLEGADQAEAAGNAEAGGEGAAAVDSFSRRASLVAHLKKKGATAAKLQGVIKDLHLKPKPRAGKPASAAANAAAESTNNAT